MVTEIGIVGGCRLCRDNGHYVFDGDAMNALYTEIDRLRRINTVLLFCLKSIINDLPTNRDWLDPALEKASREIIKKAEDQ